MPVLDARVPDTLEFQPSFVLSLTDGFTDSSTLAGAVTVNLGAWQPLFQKQSEATFVFVKVANGKYPAQVRSAPDEPYYLPADIPITLPFIHPAQTPWPPTLNWPAFPDILLADPSKKLDDPDQPVAYLAQRELASLKPSTSYPFPSGTTLVRGTVRRGGSPVSGAFVTPALLAQAGPLSVDVTNPSGAKSNSKPFTLVSGPVIGSLGDSAVIAGSPAFTLEVGGSGFVPASVVLLNGAALPTTFMSAGLLNADVTAAQIAAAGTLPVIVQNPDGSKSQSAPLDVLAAPQIDTVAPASVAAGSAGSTLTVHGAGFDQAAEIHLDGLPLPTIFVSGSEFTAKLTADQIATAAQHNVTVVNPGPPAQTSGAKVLAVVNAPVVVSLAPDSALAGSAAFTLVVEGTGFVSGAAVQWNGAALPTQFVSATELEAQVTAAQAGAAGTPSVSVVNPDGTQSATLTFEVVSGPSIDSISPAQVSLGDTPFTVVVSGSGFVAGAVARINDTDLPTTFVSSRQLDAHVSRYGYTTGDDGAFVLYFKEIKERSRNVTILVSPSAQKAVSQDVTVQRGATVSVEIDLPS